MATSCSPAAALVLRSVARSRVAVAKGTALHEEQWNRPIVHSTIWSTRKARELLELLQLHEALGSKARLIDGLAVARQLCCMPDCAILAGRLY